MSKAWPNGSINWPAAVILLKTTLLLISTTLLQWGTTGAHAGSPSECAVSSVNISALIACFDPFIKRDNTVSYKDWWNILRPTDSQRTEWRQLTNSLLSGEHCSEIQITELKELVGCSSYKDLTTGRRHSLLFETTLDANKTFTKGWGYFMTPEIKQGFPLRPYLHISAPHPITDGPVQHEAAALYSVLGAKSLTVTGARRFTVNAKAKCQPRDYAMDAAHDNETMFHSTLLEIWNWQLSKHGDNGCLNGHDSLTCLFIQFHGMKKTTCPPNTVFLSVGFKNGSRLYADPDSRISRLLKSLTAVAPKKWTVATPETSKCSLTASTNVFGRVVNRVPIGHECKTRPSIDEVSGSFIHVEQTWPARNPIGYLTWKHALANLIPTSSGTTTSVVVALIFFTISSVIAFTRRFS